MKNRIVLYWLLAYRGLFRTSDSGCDAGVMFFIFPHFFSLPLLPTSLFFLSCASLILFGACFLGGHPSGLDNTLKQQEEKRRSEARSYRPHTHKQTHTLEGRLLSLFFHVFPVVSVPAPFTASPSYAAETDGLRDAP